MKILTFVLAAGIACAQSLSLSLTPPSVAPGQSTTLNITYTDPSPSANLTAFQFQLVPGTAVTPPQTGPSAAFPNGNYIADYNAANMYTLVGGWGTTSPWTVVAIPSGRVVSWVLTVPASAPLGTSTISLNPPNAISGLPLLGVSTTGTAVALTANSVTLQVSSPYDLNGDGAINAADVTIARNIAQGKVPNGCVPPFSLIGDGKCDVLDVVLVWLAAQGLAH